MNKQIIILILFVININIFCTNDSSDDKSKKNMQPNFLFYAKDKIIMEKNSLYFTEFDYQNELDLSVFFKNRFYEFNYYINNIFLLDFLPVINSFNSFTAYQMLYNNFSTGVFNNFKIKKILKIYTNVEAGVYVPFSFFTSIYLTPGLEFSGDYYFGFFWSIKGYLPVEYFPELQSSLLTLKSNLIIGYEFFRFYGPKKFKFALTVNDQSEIFIPIPKDINTYENKLKAGTYFTILDTLQPYAYFILNTYGWFGTVYAYNLFTGFNAGINILLKYFLFTLDYSGSIDLYNINNGWVNKIEAVFKFSLYFK
ncbi:MAG: hypothetical protein JXB50_10955 [Spirochaetes bacterium]|nr:hypothetical protein [Spirochaetota bacterium]